MATTSPFEDERKRKIRTVNPLGTMLHSAKRQIMGAHGEPITIICDGMSKEEAHNRVEGAADYYNVRR